jgi:hypothetical protein
MMSDKPLFFEDNRYLGNFNAPFQSCRSGKAATGLRDYVEDIIRIVIA